MASAVSESWAFSALAVDSIPAEPVGTILRGTDTARKPLDVPWSRAAVLSMQEERVAQCLDAALEFQLHPHWLGRLGDKPLPLLRL